MFIAIREDEGLGRRVPAGDCLLVAGLFALLAGLASGCFGQDEAKPGGKISDGGLRAFAAAQASAKRAGEPVPQFSARFPDATLEEAGRVQRAYVEALLEVEEFAGIKGAVVGEGGQQFFGIEGPLSAVLFRRGWHRAENGPVRVPIRAGAEPGIETELGIILGESIREELTSVEALRKKVRAIVPVIELPAGKHDWTQAPKAVDLVAVNVDSDHYILGQETTDLSLDLDALPVRLSRDGRMLNETTGGDARRGQWWNFLHQVNWAVRQGYRLDPGHLVITGALGKICRDGAGSYRADFGNLGVIEFELEK